MTTEQQWPMHSLVRTPDHQMIGNQTFHIESAVGAVVGYDRYLGKTQILIVLRNGNIVAHNPEDLTDAQR